MMRRRERGRRFREGFALLAACALLLASAPMAAAQSGPGGSRATPLDVPPSDAIPPEAVPEDDAGPESTLDKAVDIMNRALQSQSIILGIGWTNSAFTAERDRPLSNGDRAETFLNSGGKLQPFVDYESSESYFYETEFMEGLPLAFGYSWKTRFSTFETDRETATNPFTSTASESSVKGAYAFVVPLFFVRLKPIGKRFTFSERLGLGVGAALTRFDGTVVYQGRAGDEREPVSVKADKLRPVFLILAEFRINNWVLEMGGSSIEVKQDGTRYTVGFLSFNFGYVFSF